MKVWDEIVRLAREEGGWQGPLEPAMHLVEDLELDSIQLLSLAVAVEDRFLIELDEADEAEIATLGDLCRLVEAKLAGREEPE